MSGLAELVRREVERDPTLVECLARGLASVSAVARVVAARIAERLGEEPSLPAVKMAVSRLARNLATAPGRVEELLAESTLALQDNIAIVTVPRHAAPGLVRAALDLAPSSRFVQVVQGARSATVMVAEEDLERVLEAAGGGAEVLRGQTAVIVLSPPEIVETPGFVARLTGFLAVNGVNITQIVSVWRETIIVVDSGDAARVYTLLKSVVG